MKFIETEIPGVWIIEPKVFNDERGYFMESFKSEAFEQHIRKMNFIQENESKSIKGVLRGLHYQMNPFAQAKLVRVIKGAVLDVAVDIRVGSPTYGLYIAVELSEENKKQLYIPRGFAHGFKVMSDEVIFTYKVDNPYHPKSEGTIRFDDPTLNINWGVLNAENIIVSPKDKNAPFLKDAKNNFIFNQE